MAGQILTPTAIWKDFDIPFVPSAEIIKTEKEESITFTELYIQGQVGNGETAKIYATLVKPSKKGKLPTVLILQDLEGGFNKELTVKLCEQGYAVLSVDLAGNVDGEKGTFYPKSMEYAYYQNAKNNLSTVNGSVTETCWYEWARATRYVLKYLLNQSFVEKVGGIAIGEVATALWQVAGSSNEVSCSVFVLNAGWRGYRGINKFGGDVEPQFSDDMYKFIAGVEPQAYAMHIKTPVLMLSATNSDIYDCDRASDTVARIDEKVFTAIHYSVGYRQRVSGEAFRVAEIFFEEFLKKDKSQFTADVDVSCEIIDGKIRVEVLADGQIKNVELYASEEIVEPAKRSWIKVGELKKGEDSKYVFNYLPYHNSNQANFFAQITFKNGFVAGTKIINKKFNAKEILPSHKSKILYSSRVENNETVFHGANQDLFDNHKINLEDKKRVFVKKGPMGIEGVGCKWGLLTFKFSAEKDKPIDDAILMFDIFSKEQGEMQVKLISDYFGAKTEYIETVKLLGGDVWQNVKVAINRFKTKEGMVLKTYGKIEAVEFIGNEEFLINNALWV